MMTERAKLRGPVSTPLGEDVVFARLAIAERKIQAIMLELSEEMVGSGWQIDHISVDTRTWANMKPEILVSQRTQCLLDPANTTT